MQTFIDVFTLFNTFLLLALGFKLAGARATARRLEIAIGDATASLVEYRHASLPVVWGQSESEGKERSTSASH